LGWDREGKYKQSEFHGKNVVFKRFRLSAPYNRIQLVLFYPLFWAWIFSNLLACKPKVVHACDLDTLIPSYVFSELFSTKLVFDSFDRYALAFIPTKYRMLYKIVNAAEELLACNADALITVSEERLSTFGNHKPAHVEVVMNCAEDRLGPLSSGSTSNVKSKGDLTLVYAGAIAYRRGLVHLSKAIQGIKGANLILAGMIFDGCIKELLQNPNVHYVGLLQHDEALKLQLSADVIPILYDPAIPIASVANPTKLFEAMMLGKPVVTNVCEELVNQVGCGYVVDYDPASIRDALLRLNSSSKQEMGYKARMAFEKTFNWECMEKKLLTLYDKMLTTNE
jgi:glycosyltransferase involved in cell wall biosynthesis